MAEFKVTVCCNHCQEVLDHDFVAGHEITPDGQLPAVHLHVGLDHRCATMEKYGFITVREQLAEEARREDL